MDEVNESSLKLLSGLNNKECNSDRIELINTFLNICTENCSTSFVDFPEGQEWFNIKSPLSLKQELSGKIVVLDFFTYCCINCMHILPDLEEVENKFKDTDGVVVIGVHSAKFDNEKLSSNILSAILRYGITHPVVNDYDATMWNELGISCWPTLVIVGPSGETLLALVGEGHRQNLLDFIEQATKFYGDKGKLNFDPIDIHLCKDSLPPSPVLFPGKVAVSACGLWLAISDTGQHCIVASDLNGVVHHRIGTGQAGFKDGPFGECQFRSPQGICWDRQSDIIYVADTENHAIRQISLSTQNVITLAGTGFQGQDKEGGLSGPQQPISSPWDVCLGKSIGSEQEDLLFVAMAGTHQIWMYFLNDGTWLRGEKFRAGTCMRLAGSGEEENRNNNYPHKAGFAQPSGICAAYFNVTTKVFGQKPRVELTPHLIVADSESSSVRSVNLTDGSVKAVVGGQRDPKDLFAFGDADGSGYDAKLQHPLGVTAICTEAIVYVADSYNHKVKRVDLNTKECSTLIGCGESGDYTGSDCLEHPALNEPGDLCLHPDGQTLFIADTNNHCIKVYEIQSGVLNKLTLIDKPQSLTTAKNSPLSKPAFQSIVNKKATRIDEDRLQLSVGDRLNFVLSLDMGEGLHLTEGAPSACQICLRGADNDIVDCAEHFPKKYSVSEEDRFIRFKLDITESMKVLEKLYIECAVFYCDDAGVCMNKGYVINLPVTVNSTTAENLDAKKNTLNLNENYIDGSAIDNDNASTFVNEAKTKTTILKGNIDKCDREIQYSLTLVLPKY